VTAPTLPEPARTRWPRWPRRSLRLRLTLLYGGLFLASGALLLAITNVGARTSVVASVRDVQPLPPRPPAPGSGSGSGSFIEPGNHFDRLAVSSLVALAVMGVLSLVLGWMVAGRALRPLRTITTTARAISASNLHRRLGMENADDEFRELGETLDDLFGRLEASFESQRHFVANASHELRTPLTAERTLLQVALADPDVTVATLRSTCEEVLTLGEQQERLIEALLALAGGEQGVERWESFDVAEIAARVVDGRGHELERRGIDLETTFAPAPAEGQPSLAESLVANLVDNALRHNLDSGGRIEVSTGTVEGRSTISVRNTGPTIPPDELDRLFQPFQRLGDERVRHGEGHGLGLAIVHAIAGAHGATLAARARPEGGLDIDVTFRS
jgi:signal transduction histidine kinase